MTVETVTAQSWKQEVVESDIPVLVNFSAVRCGFCMALEPIYDRLSYLYSGKLSFLKLMVNDPHNQEVPDRISLGGTPTLKFYCQGREVGEHVGYAIEPVLKKKIEDMLEEMDACIKNSTPLQQKK